MNLRNKPPFSQWLTDKITNPGRESAMGTHVIDTFIQNPYAFYLKYVCGYKPIHTKPALTKGSIIHSAIEAAYLYGETQMLEAANALFSARSEDYEERERHATDWRESIVMLTSWANTWLAYDHENYHILHIEDQFELALPNGYLITIRPDIILQSKGDSEIVIRDHKTTGWGALQAHQDLEDGDQSTAYIWGTRKLYPNNRILGLESDVIFKRSNMMDAKCLRPGIIQRSDWYIGQWELSMIAWIQDIARRVQMLGEGYPAAFAFPRGESKWGPGDWAGIYRTPLPEDPTEAPYGYQIDEWQRERAQAMLDLDNAKEGTQDA